MQFQGATVALVVLAAIAVLIAWQLNKIGKPLTIPEISSQGIISLEFAFRGPLSKDYEIWTDTSEAFLYIAMSLSLRRLV